MAKKGQGAKCVAIANDILEQIRLKHYKAIQGTYLDSEELVHRLTLELGDKEKIDAQPIFKKSRKVEACDVCMIGAAFMSAVCLYDKFDFFKELLDDGFGPESPVGDGTMRQVLKDYFEESEIRNMEDTFEGFENIIEDEEGLSVFDDGVITRWSPLAEEIMTIICHNIIRNKGHFHGGQALIKDATQVFQDKFKKAKRINVPVLA